MSYCIIYTLVSLIVSVYSISQYEMLLTTVGGFASEEDIDEVR